MASAGPSPHAPAVTALLYAFGSALCWAGLDAARKVLVERTGAVVPLVVGLTLAQAPVFAVWAVFDGTFFTSAGYLAPGVGALLLNVLANVAFVRAVQLSPLSVTVPLLSLTPVFTGLLAIPLLGEWPARWQWVGIALVVVGAFALHVSRETRSLRDLWRSFLEEKGSKWMAAVALLWSLTGPLDKLALRHASVPAHALVQTAGVGVLLLVALLLRGRLGRLRRLRGSGRHLALAATLAVGALGLQLHAFALLLVALVETLKRAVGMTLSVVFGRLFFGESVTAPKIVAIVLMAGGTALLTLPGSWLGL